MMRKGVSYLLVISIVMHAGCYSRQMIVNEELNGSTRGELTAEVEGRDVVVITKGSSEYRFLKGNYRIHADTLIGFGIQKMGIREVEFHGSIPLASIVSLETETFNTAGTIFWTALPVGIIVGFSFWLSAQFSRH
jgi:hypothetical protein